MFQNKTRQQKRIAGSVLMAVGTVEFSVGCLIWYTKAHPSLFYLFWGIGVLFLFWGRAWRKR